MTDFNLRMEDEDDVLLTEQIQMLLVKNNRVLFMQTKSQKFFNDWLNSNFFDLEEDVYKGVVEALEAVDRGLTMYSYGFINKIIMKRYRERTGIESLEELMGNLTKKFRGYDEK